MGRCACALAHGRPSSCRSVVNHRGFQRSVEANDLGPVDVGDLAAIVNGIVAERLDFVRERGMGAMGPLMGVVMQAAQGADGKEVSALLRAAIQAAVE